MPSPPYITFTFRPYYAAFRNDPERLCTNESRNEDFLDYYGYMVWYWWTRHRLSALTQG